MTPPKIDPAGRVSLAHGNGGRLMRELIDGVFAPILGGPLDTHVDAAALPLAVAGPDWLITTDGFTVEPLEFPGGDIGSLAVHGTVNDLAVSGAQPRFLTLNVFIEEGLEIAVLQRITQSMARACAEAGVRLLAGDTKVVRRGQGGGLYLATTGVGQRLPGPRLGLDQIRPGDQVIASGTLGDHGAAVMLAREQFGRSGDLRSDAASVLPVTALLMRHPGLRFMRDPTRGGMATVAHDIASATGATVHLFEAQLPIRQTVAGVCEILGYDPLYLASEGRVVAVVSPAEAAAAVAALQAGGFAEARIIGHVEPGAARVVLQTALGGQRILQELEDDPLPRICCSRPMRLSRLSLIRRLICFSRRRTPARGANQRLNRQLCSIELRIATCSLLAQCIVAGHGRGRPDWRAKRPKYELADVTFEASNSMS